jgi:hypothetical protein
LRLTRVLKEERVSLSRKFIDAEGVHWQVYELADPGLADRFQSVRWLYFFSRAATRSLAVYPDDWASLDWPGLDRLCGRAEPPAHRDSVARPPSVTAQGADE